MSTDTLPTPAETAADPFRIGYRYVMSAGPDGRATRTAAPLTLEDFLHPQEGDQFVTSLIHGAILFYLAYALEVVNARRDGFTIVSDVRTDWQVEGIRPHGPDLVAFDHFPADYNLRLGTTRVADSGATPLAVIEVTSEETRAVDFEAKFLEYFDAGVPFYVIVDAAAPEGSESVHGFGRGPAGFEPLATDPMLGVFVPTLGVWLRWEGGRAVAADESGRDIPPSREAAAQRRAAEERADAAERRAVDLARELAALRARLTSTE